MKLFLLTVIFIINIHNFFSRDFCKEYCQSCCDCGKKGNEGSEESEEEIIPEKNNFKYNWNISKYKANIEDNLKEEIKEIDKKSNAFKYLKIAEAIKVYNDENNNKILRDNNLKNKIEQYKIIVKYDSCIRPYCDEKAFHEGSYNFAEVKELFKKKLYFYGNFSPTEKFFKYFYHPEYLETNFDLFEKPRSKYLDDNSKNFGYINLSKEEAKKDDLDYCYNYGNNILFNYFDRHYTSFTDFYKLKLHQIYKWLDDNQENANLNDPDNIYSILDIIAKQRTGLCKNEAENIISSMFSAIISFINKKLKIDDIEIFTYAILSDFRQEIANNIINNMIIQPNVTNYLKAKEENDARNVQENANVIKIYINAFLNTNVGFTQHMSKLSFFDKAVEQANAFLKEFFNFGRLFEIILQYAKQAQANVSINNFIEEIEKFEVTYSDICAITEIPEVKNQIKRKIEPANKDNSKKSFAERLDKYLEIDKNKDLRNWMNNNSQKSLKELIEICKKDYDEDAIGNCDHYFYLPELTEFYFNKDPDNIINYFTYILFPLYLLKENYIKIKS